MRKLRLAVLLGALFVSASAPAENKLLSSILAPPENKWSIRVRAVYLNMANKSDAVPALGVPENSIHVSSMFIPEVDISYFFTRHIAAELVLTYPQKHDLDISASALGGFKAGTFSHLPPTLLLQYHFWPDSRFRPYLGGGVNYTFLFNEKLKVPNVTGLHLESGSLGGALQLGFDVVLSKNIFLNFDVKKIYIDSNVKNNAGMKISHVDLDPIVAGIGLGWRF